MLATETNTKERVKTLLGITDTLDGLECIEIPKGSIENTVSFLDNLFKGNYEQPSKVRNN